MLVLTRKAGQKIIIDSDEGVIELTVRKIKGNRVIVDINAPPEYAVRRGELAKFDDGSENAVG